MSLTEKGCRESVPTNRREARRRLQTRVSAQRKKRRHRKHRPVRRWGLLFLPYASRGEVSQKESRVSIKRGDGTDEGENQRLPLNSIILAPLFNQISAIGNARSIKKGGSPVKDLSEETTSFRSCRDGKRLKRGERR